MAAQTFAQLQNELGRVLGTGVRSGDDIRTSFQRWINQACRKIIYAYPWDSARAEQRITTVAPYTTGTATFTNGSATVTGSGTVWSTAFLGRKIARTVAGPYYRIATRVSDTEITISDTYAEDTATGVAYTIYQDEYNLAATTHSIEANAILFGASWQGPLLGYEHVQVESSYYGGASTGQPIAWAVVTSTTVGTPRVRLLPIPDDVYRASFRYLKTWTDLSADGDLYTTQGLPEDVEELIIDRALRWAPRVEGSRRVMTDTEFRRELALVYAAHHKRRSRSGQRGMIGTASADPRIVYDMGAIEA